MTCHYCGSDENSCDCAIRHTSEGLEEIELLESYFVGMVDDQGNCYGQEPRYRAEELAYLKLNEIIERVNLLTNILIRLKKGEAKDG